MKVTGIPTVLQSKNQPCGTIGLLRGGSHKNGRDITFHERKNNFQKGLDKIVKKNSKHKRNPC